jgi:hypothetical protein
MATSGRGATMGRTGAGVATAYVVSAADRPRPPPPLLLLLRRPEGVAPPLLRRDAAPPLRRWEMGRWWREGECGFLEEKFVLATVFLWRRILWIILPPEQPNVRTPPHTPLPVHIRVERRQRKLSREAEHLSRPRSLAFAPPPTSSLSSSRFYDAPQDGLHLMRGRGGAGRLARPEPRARRPRRARHGHGGSAHESRHATLAALETRRRDVTKTPACDGE